MNYLEFIKDIDHTIDSIDLCKRYLEQFHLHPTKYSNALEILSEHKGDHPTKGSLMLIKNTLNELNFQIWLMREDFKVTDASQARASSFAPSIIPSVVKGKDLENANL